MRYRDLLSSVDVERAFKHVQPILDLSIRVEELLKHAHNSGNGDPSSIVDIFLIQVRKH
jgi:hypothetical protein